MLVSRPTLPGTTVQAERPFQGKNNGFYPSPEFTELFVYPMAFDHIQDIKVSFLGEADILIDYSARGLIYDSKQHLQVVFKLILELFSQDLLFYIRAIVLCKQGHVPPPFDPLNFLEDELRLEVVLDPRGKIILKGMGSLAPRHRKRA